MLSHLSFGRPSLLHLLLELAVCLNLCIQIFFGRCRDMDLALLAPIGIIDAESLLRLPIRPLNCLYRRRRLHRLCGRRRGVVRANRLEAGQRGHRDRVY